MPEEQGLYIDVTSRCIWVDGIQRPYKLSKSECKLLRYLATREGEICSREETVFAVYESIYQGKIDDGRLDAMVERIRKKIEDEPRSPRFLRTVHRLGHRLDGYNGNVR
jgi:two-component system, OmpR family, response regulator RegX3